MTLKRRFIDEYYSSYKEYVRARKDDYCKVQFEWSCFMDCLCRDGEITQNQYEREVF